jgi:hypothetical protein
MMSPVFQNELSVMRRMQETLRQPLAARLAGAEGRRNCAARATAFAPHGNLSGVGEL